MSFIRIGAFFIVAAIAVLLQGPSVAQQMQTQPSSAAASAITSQGHRLTSVHIDKEDLSIIQAILQIGGYFFSIMAVVFAAIVGVNVYQGSVVLKDARGELNAAKEEMLALRKAKLEYEALIGSKQSVDSMVASAITAIKSEAKAAHDESVRQLYRNSKIIAYIREAKEELKKVTPSEDYLYPRVTATFGYLDPDVIDLFRACIEQLPKESEVVRGIFKHGFRTLQPDLHIQFAQRKADAA